MAKKFLTDINIAGGIYDSSGDIGNSGQILSSTGSGLNWVDSTANSSVIYQDAFSGNGSATAFTLANSVDNENKTQVYVDGVYQFKNTYSISGTTLTFSTAPPNNTNIEVISFNSITGDGDILTDSEFGSAGLMTTNGSGVYSITTNNSSNWNTAYTYSQVGHLPLAGGAITGAITTNSTFDGRDVSVDGTKLDGIETSATADQTDAEIRTAVEAATDSNVFTDADHTKLNAIEASADVTDTTNVTAAGALMDSEVTNLADVKAFDTADYATAAQGTLADSAQQPPSEGAFANGDKTKLDGIAAGAEVNVQSDWSSASGDNLILNKPSIPSITGLATETYVDTAVSDLVDSSPATLNTLNELAAALGDDPNFATTTATSIGTKLPLAGGTLTGGLTGTTADFSGVVDFQGDAAIEGGSGYGIFNGYSANHNHFIAVRGILANTSTYSIAGGHQTTFVEHADAADEGWYFKSFTTGTYREIARIDGLNEMYLGGNQVIHTASSSYNNSNWDTAYGWGDHGAAGYLTSSSTQSKYLRSDATDTMSVAAGTSEFLTFSNTTSGGTVQIGFQQNDTDGLHHRAYFRAFKGTGAASGAFDLIVRSSGGGITADILSLRNGSNDATWRGHTIWNAGNFTNNSTNWNTAYGWGNHASAGYLTSVPNHSAATITSGTLSNARLSANLSSIASTLDDTGIYFRAVNEKISGEAYALAFYGYNANDGFLFLNRDGSSVARPIFHIGGFNNAATTGDVVLTLSRGDGIKNTSLANGLSSSSYRTNIVKTTTKTIFTDTQGLHEFNGRVNLSSTGLASSPNLSISNSSTSAFMHTGELFTPNMTAGQANIFVIGKAGSTKNAGYIGYNYSSAGSNNNYVTIGHWGQDHLLRVYGDVITSQVSFRGSSDVRGTLFYDTNDTTYYTNPAGESKIVKLWINNGGAGGVPWSTGFNQGSGSNYWNQIQDAGVARQRNFGTGGYDWFSSGGTQLMDLDNNGSLFAAASMKAPIFYDSANTAFYVNPPAESNLAELRLNVGGLQLYRAYNDNAIWFAANSDANHALWNDYYGGPGTRPGGTVFDGIKWNAYRGIHIRGGTGGAYDIIVAQNTTSNANTHTVELYAYNVKQFQTVSGYALAPNQMRSPIFYDSAATSYYVDPASATSINVAGTIRGNYFVGTNYATNGYTIYKGYDNWNHYIVSRGHTRPGQSKAQAAILGGHQTSFVEYCENNSTTGFFFIGSANTTYEEIAKITKDFASFTQVRAPLYYDSNNTNYYLDPHSTSVIVGLTMAGALQTAGSHTVGSSGTANLYMGGTSGNYFRFHTNNSHTYFDANVGDIHWRQGASTRFTFYMTSANMTINGSLTQNSDERVKENIVEIPNAIDKVKAMKGVYYNRTDFNTGVTKVGVLAQEVEAVLPELIVEAPDSGLKSVAYGELTAVLINAVKELEARVQELENN